MEEEDGGFLKEARVGRFCVLTRGLKRGFMVCYGYEGTGNGCVRRGMTGGSHLSWGERKTVSRLGV